MSGYKHILLWLAGLLGCSLVLQAQPVPISLETAQRIAQRNHPDVQQDIQAIEYQRRLVGSDVPQQETAFYLAGTQINPRNGDGINGVGVQQQFNWPGTRRKLEEAAAVDELVGNARLAHTQLELRHEVAAAYYQVLYYQDNQRLAEQELELMQEMVELAQRRFDLGETNKIPVLSAIGKEKAAVLRLQQARHDQDIAELQLNQWLWSDTLYTVAGTGLPAIELARNWYVSPGHPALLYHQQSKVQAEAQIAVEKVLLLPQLTAGAQVQHINGSLPFYGYLLGVSLPVGRRSAQTRMEAAEMEATMEEDAVTVTRRALEQRRTKLLSQLAKEESTLDYLDRDLKPLMEEQLSAARRAYGQGTIEYAYYLLTVEQVLGSRRERLEALRRYHLLRLELEFLSGRR